MRDYNTIERGIAVLADGGLPYQTTDALYVPPSMSILSRTSTACRMALGYCRIVNRSGGTVLAGMAGRIDRTRWRAGQSSSTGLLTVSTYTEDTTDAQDSDDDDFPVETTGVHSGFLVGSADPFTLLCLRITTASVGGGAVREIQYPTAAGTWATLANPLIAVPQGVWATGARLIWWQRPADQVLLTAAHFVTGTDARLAGLHGIRIHLTTVGTTAAVARSLSVFEAIQANVSLADDTAYEINPGGESEFKFAGQHDALFGILSDVTAGQNLFHVNARLLG
mgnify:FL=1